MNWPALDAALAALSTTPFRTGSVIATIYGDAILPRGGSLALSDLLVLMRRLGASDGVVRTAVSRLAKDGVLVGRRTGRHSAYALSPTAKTEFGAAVPQIYAMPTRQWDGRLRLAFPDPGADRTTLEAAGFALLAPGVMLAPWNPPPGVICLEASGTDATARALADRAWPLTQLAEMYATFKNVFSSLLPAPEVSSLDAIAGRVATIHAWRRIALRDRHLPPGLLPPGWPGDTARQLCIDIYSELANSSEAWLDSTSSGGGPLPSGPDPVQRFSQAMAPPPGTGEGRTA